MQRRISWIEQLGKRFSQARRGKQLWLALPSILCVLSGASYAEQVDVTLSWPPRSQALLTGEPTVTVAGASMSPGTSVQRREPLSEQELIIIGRDAQGRERYRTVVADPSAVRAEVFDPISGQIEQRREVTRPVEQLRLALPKDDRVRRLSIYRPRFQQNGYALEPMAEVDLPERISSASLAPTAVAAATTVINNGLSTNRVDLVFLGDGYRAAELGKYAQDVNTILASFFNIEPYRSYAKFFNVHRVDVVSNQSGVDHPERRVFRDTALDGTYNCSGIQRLICASTTKVSNAVAAALPAAARDIVVVVVNDSEYGGSGGANAVISTNAAAVNLALHEVGHSFGLLADEYTTNPELCVLSEPRELNSTTILNRSTTKWSYWISTTTPLPTPSSFGNGTPGLFLGSRYCSNGMYRPTSDSMMRTLGAPFYAINEEALVKRYYAFTRPIDASSPTNTNLSLSRTQSQLFTITPPVTAGNTIVVYWYLDGVFQVTGNRYTVSAARLALGTHTVQALVRDTTAKVRRDTGNRLSQTRSWNVNVISSALSALSQAN